jgi:hypothetical protein
LCGLDVIRAEGRFRLTRWLRFAGVSRRLAPLRSLAYWRTRTRARYDRRLSRIRRRATEVLEVCATGRLAALNQLTSSARPESEAFTPAAPALAVAPATASEAASVSTPRRPATSLTLQGRSSLIRAQSGSGLRRLVTGSRERDQCDTRSRDRAKGDNECAGAAIDESAGAAMVKWSGRTAEGRRGGAASLSA